MRIKLILLFVGVVLMTLSLCFSTDLIINYALTSLLIITFSSTIFMLNNKRVKLVQEVEGLYEDIEKLKTTATNDDLVIDEMTDVLEKLKIGFLGYETHGLPSNNKLVKLIDTLNKSTNKFNDDIDIALNVLTEYGGANFDFDIDLKGASGKTGSLLLGIRALGSSISELIALISITANALEENVGILSTASGNLSVSANQQAASLEETAAALEEITSTIINNTENTHKMALYAKDVNIASQEGKRLSDDTAKSMREISSTVSGIKEAIAVIDKISFQTNILSLNAAVEAATAGEAGKGFAVVAAEVRNLANRSAEAAKEIKLLVEEANNKTKNGIIISEQMTNGYEKLSASVQNTIVLIGGIADASKEQRVGIEQINDAVTELDQSTQQNALAASNISEMSNDTKELSLKLTKITKEAKFDKQALDQVCNMDLTMFLNKLKLDHVNFKNNNSVKLKDKMNWTVVNERECNLGKWIIESEKNNEVFTKTNNWESLKKVHLDVHSGMQEIITENSQESNNIVLGNKAKELDQAISNVFQMIQKVKREICE